MSSYLTLSTGKQVRIWGIVGLGIDPQDDNSHMHLFCGSDGGIETVIDSDYDHAYESGDELSRAECVELADLMIAAWQKYRAKAAG